MLFFAKSPLAVMSKEISHSRFRELSMSTLAIPLLTSIATVISPRARAGADDSKDMFSESMSFIARPTDCSDLTSTEWRMVPGWNHNGDCPYKRDRGQPDKFDMARSCGANA